MDLKPINLTPDEELHLRLFATDLKKEQELEVTKLYMNCNNPYTFAKAHSDYVKDWERTKKTLEDNLRNGITFPDTSINLYREMIKFSAVIMDRKLEAVRMSYERKFGESIYTYVGEDGKLKGILKSMRDVFRGEE